MEVQWWLIGIGAVLFFIALYLLGTSGAKDVRGRAAQIEGRYDPNLSWWLAIFRRLSIKPRIELIEGIKEENEAQIEFVKTDGKIEAAKLESTFIVPRAQEIRDVEVAATDNTLAQLDEATRRKVSVEGLSQIRVVEATNESTLVLEKGKSEIRISEKQRLDKLEIEKEWALLEQRLKGSFIFNERTHQYLKMQQEFLFGLYDDRKRLQESEDLAKEDKLEVLNEFIGNYEVSFRERQTRLLQAASPEDNGTGDEDTDGAGDSI